MHPCAVKSGGYEPEQYARYKDKGELFAAVLQWQIDRWLAMNDIKPGRGASATASWGSMVPAPCPPHPIASVQFDCGEAIFAARPLDHR
jgi:hypothetical protein